MTWGMFEPSGDGDFWPYGKYIDWDAKLEHHFNNVMSEAERQVHDNSQASYNLFVSDKFTNEIGVPRKWDPTLTPLAEHEQPSGYQTRRTYKTLGSLIKLDNRQIAVDQPFKDIIEKLEPGVHQFWPFKILMPKGKEYPVPYYGIVIGTFLDAFRPDQSDEGSWDERSGRYTSTNGTKSDVAGLAMSRKAIGAAHLWRERHLTHPDFYLSDDLQAKIKQVGLRVTKHHKMKDV